MNKIIANSVSKENFCNVVNAYIKQLQKEQDITVFENVFGYYMYEGLVHELRLDGDQIVDETYESWSIKEKNFVMNELNHKVF